MRHTLSIERRPKVDAENLVSWVCSCGSEGGPDTLHEAMKAGDQHKRAKEQGS